MKPETKLLAILVGISVMVLAASLAGYVLKPTPTTTTTATTLPTTPPILKHLTAPATYVDNHTIVYSAPWPVCYNGSLLIVPYKQELSSIFNATLIPIPDLVVDFTYNQSQINIGPTILPSTEGSQILHKQLLINQTICRNKT